MTLLPDPIKWLEANWRHDKTSAKAGELWALKDFPPSEAIIRAYADTKVRQLVVMSAAQGSKTVTSMACLCWALACNPDTTLWAMPSDRDAEDVGERLLDAISKCHVLQLMKPDKRYAVTITGIDFPLGRLQLIGAGGKGNQVSGKPVGRLHIDEEKDWDSGTLNKALKRVRSRWNSKVFRVSTPKEHGDTIHEAFLQGTQKRWYLRCPNCGEQHPFGWRINEEQPLIKWTQGDYDSIEYLFPCGHKRLTDCNRDRRWILEEGFWLPTNPKADKDYESFTYSSLLPPWVTWKSVVIEFEQAMRAIKQGDRKPLEVWVTETLGEPWVNRVEAAPEKMNQADYHLKDFSRGSVIEPLLRWEGEVLRIMTIDRQKGRMKKGDNPHRWATIRAWRANGESRLLWAGRIETKEGCREMQQLFGVPDEWTFQDTGFETDMVYQECAEYNWTGIRGDEQSENWLHPNEKGKLEIKRPYSRIQRTQVGDKAVRYIHFSKERMSDICSVLRSGSGVSWEVGLDTPSIYFKHMGGQSKVEEFDKKRGKTRYYWKKIGEDHLLDCEIYQVAAAVMRKLLASTESVGVDEK